MNAATNNIAGFRVGSSKVVKVLGKDPDLNETIRRRLRHAREINGFDQITAAQVMQYRNSSALSKIESGFAKIPKDFILKAAVAYGVSIDYLMGMSDEPERDPETAERMAILKSVRETVKVQTDSLVTVLLKNAADMTPMTDHMTNMLKRIDQLFESFDKVCRKNPEFQDDVIAGSALQRAVDEAHTAANDAKRFMQRRQALVEARSKEVIQSASYPLFPDL